VRRIIQSISFIATLFLLLSCTPQPCIEESVSAVKGSFYITGSDKVQTADSVTLYGIGVDTVMLYDKSINISKIEMPLNPDEETSSFLLKTNGISDTITFTYTSFPYLVSKECGFTFYHTIESVTSTKNLIDTVLIRYSTITTGDEENIRIFY
jgi:hypothetical protein